MLCYAMIFEIFSPFAKTFQIVSNIFKAVIYTIWALFNCLFNKLDFKPLYNLLSFSTLVLVNYKPRLSVSSTLNSNPLFNFSGTTHRRNDKCANWRPHFHAGMWKMKSKQDWKPFLWWRWRFLARSNQIKRWRFFCCCFFFGETKSWCLFAGS